MSAVLSAIVPVFLVVGVGFMVRRRFNLDAKTLATLNIYVFIPALVFGDPHQRAFPWSTFGRFAGALVALTLAMTAILTVVARLRRMPPEQEGAFLMTMFPNLGNFGLPVCKFAFGEKGLALAVLVMVCGSFLQNSVGVFFAQRSRHSAMKAFLRVFHFPMVYAFVLSLVFQNVPWQLPEVVLRAIEITADAAIPVQLMILGVTVAETRLDLGVDVLLACVCRLCAAPLLALATAWAMGLHDLAMKVFVLQLSGPVAVGMAVYGVQFDVRPGFLASTVSASFLFSVITVSAVLAILYAIP